MAGKLSKKDRETRERMRLERRAQEDCEAQVRALCREDDFGGGLNHLSDYPRFDDRELSTFEGDLRDWGFVFGLAFGTILGDNTCGLPNAEAAAVAYRAARNVFVDWSGEIENPVEKREQAIRALVRRYADDEKRRDVESMAGRRSPDPEWASDLRGAVQEVVEWARG